MIAKLSGRIDSVGAGRLILDVGGVGYLVQASGRTLARIGAAGEAVSLLIDTQVREDAFNLYGFCDAAEQDWFRLLTGVQGVGAKAALAILSATPPDRLGFAIAAGDAAVLRQAEGVGPKLAARIVTELKDKAAKIDLAPRPAKAAAPTAGAPAAAEGAPGMEQDAVSALVNLGYSRADAYAAVARILSNDNVGTPDLQAVIRGALKTLAN